MEFIKRENKMSIQPIGPLLIKMSLPMIASMLVQALYNVVDSIFVSRVSEDALSAVSLAFPLQMLIVAVGVGTGIGVNSLIARRLGEKRQQDANEAAVTGQFLALISSLVFMLLFSTLSRPLLNLFVDKADASSMGDILEMSVSYLRICGSFCIFSIFQIMIEKTLQGTGNTFKPMLIQIIGAVINLILDPILIFGLLGFPALGVSGAAIATVIGQAVGMVFGFVFLFGSSEKLVIIRFKGFRPKREVLKNIYRVGLPSIFMQAIGSFTTFCLNLIMISFTPTAVSVLGIYYKLQSFIFMPVFGMNSGAMPLMAFNYGAKNKARLLSALRYACLYAFAIMCLGTLLFMLFPEALLSLFEASAELTQIGTIALRTISISFPVAAFCIMISSLFQALGLGIYSLMISALRQIVVILPAAYILASTFGLNAIWWSFPIAEIVALVICVFVFIRINRKYIQPLDSIKELT